MHRIPHHLTRFLLSASLLLASACSTAPPEGIRAVTPFDVQRYTGKWYEIARLDHSFERGLSNVSARYRIQTDGSLEVINRGFSADKKTWRETTGRAVFTGAPDRASLKVSFFGPFYGGYHVVALDAQNYAWAMVTGPSRDYLWILSRTRRLPDGIREKLLEQARTQGFAIEKLIWVEQNRDDA